MSAHIVLACDGTLPSGMPCRGALHTRTLNKVRAWSQAVDKGWTTVAGRERCPSCTRRGDQ